MQEGAQPGAGVAAFVTEKSKKGVQSVGVRVATTNQKLLARGANGEEDELGPLW